MRVRISYSVDVDDDYRRAINAYYGRPGLATRKDVQAWHWHFGHSEDDNLACLDPNQYATDALPDTTAPIEELG